MNTYRWRRIKTGLRKIMGIQPLYAVVAFGRGTSSIYDPTIPGNVWVQIQYANGLGDPYSVRGPSGTSVQLGVGTWVELQPTPDNRLKIVNYSDPANAAAGVNTLAANTPTLQSGGYVGQQSVITALVCPEQTPDLTVIIKAWNPIVNGTYYEYPGTPSGGFDLSGSVPSTGNNLIALVFLNSDYATPSVAVSTARATSDLPLGQADIQEALTAGLVANPGATPLAAIRLYGGQTQIMQGDIVQDIRQLIDNTQASGTGNVTGPATSTDHAAARWNGTTGQLLADSGVLIDNSNNVTIPGIETTQSGKVRKTRVVTAAGAVTVATSDDIVEVNKTSGAATVVNLPATPATGMSVEIRDGKGDAATHNITITPAAGNINGAATLVLNVAYAAALCTYDGTQWSAAIAETGSAGSGNVTGISPTVVADFAMWDDTAGTTINDTGLSLSTDGTFAGNSDSLVPSQKAAKTYTDNAVQNAINGLAPKADLALWTNAALPAVVYSNGSSGVGATLIAVSTGVLTVDGVAVTSGMRIGVKDQVAQLQNGYYVVTTAGALGVAFILTRTTDANTSAELLGAYAFALQGTVNADTAYLCSNSSAITIGTTAITFVKFQGAGINQLTGDATAGPGTGSQALTLVTVNSNVGSFSGPLAITANAKGLITAIATVLLNLATQVTGLLSLANGGSGADLSGTGPGVPVQPSLGAALTVVPVLNGDLVNFVFKSEVRTVSTTNINIASAPGTIGGATYTSGNQRVLLTGQSTGSQNGIWIWTGSGNALTRPTDYATGLVIPAQQGLMVFVQSGTNAATFWQFQSLSAATVDTTSMSFSLVNSTVRNMLQSTDQTDILFNFKCLVDAVADTNLNIASAPSSIDGVTTTLGAIRVLLTNQSTPSQNGLWTASSGNAMVRPTDYAAGYAFAFSQGITVEAGTGGTTYKNSRWRCTTAPTVTVDTTSTTWAQILVAVAAVPGLPGSIITSGTVPAANLGTMTADSGSGGAKGAAPAPATGDAVRGLFGDATYAGTARKLVDLTVLGASAANIDLTSIPATYKHLMIELELRSDRAANAADNAYIRLNNDSTAADYYSYSIHMNGTTPTFNILERLAATATGIECNLSTTAATAPANEYGYFQIWIYNYASVANNRKIEVKTLNRTGTASGNLRHILTAGWWLNTAAAVSRITILPVNGSNWVAGSSYMLYGFS